jgi:thioesterase domain-containing protein
MASLLQGGIQDWVDYAKDKRGLWTAKLHAAWQRTGWRLSQAHVPSSACSSPDATEILLWLLRRYRPQPYHGDMTLFRSTVRTVTDFDPLRGWSKFAKGRITVCEVPGDHFSMIDEDRHNRVLAEQLERQINAALSVKT